MRRSRRAAGRRSCGRHASVATPRRHVGRTPDRCRSCQTPADRTVRGSSATSPSASATSCTSPKPGFDSQAFVVEPPADGSPVELDVELEAATGRLTGTVTGPSGPLGNVDIVVTDGTLTFATSSDTGDDSRRLVAVAASAHRARTRSTATLHGFGTEVMQITLGAGERRDDVDITHAPRRRFDHRPRLDRRRPFGGVTVTAVERRGHPNDDVAHRRRHGAVQLPRPRHPRPVHGDGVDRRILHPVTGGRCSTGMPRASTS